MWKEFKAFLIKQNALALALAVVIGAALNTVVKSFVDDVIMPIVTVLQPSGTWRNAKLDAGPFHFAVGDLAASVINFLIIGFVAWRISKAFIPSAPTAVPNCQFCRMPVDNAATRCPHCTSQLAAS
jgi:large conductance mechanosensitive channel